jgi:hypothetical protein
MGRDIKTKIYKYTYPNGYTLFVVFFEALDGTWRQSGPDFRTKEEAIELANALKSGYSEIIEEIDA